jgi:tetratricopeptide (TPR) repeat protein
MDLSRPSKVLLVVGVLSLESWLPVRATEELSSNVGREETVLIESPSVNSGSGVIVKKEGDVYTVLTAAHVVGANGCARKDSITLVTPDKQTHSILSDQIFCSEVRRDLLGKSSLCNEDTSPYALDLAVLKFRSSTSYKVASKQGEISRNGVHVIVSGYPVSGEGAGRLRLVKSDGPVSPPPESAESTCEGYGLRYVASTSAGMSGGGVWTENGALVGIHGRRLETRKDDLVLAAGSFSLAVPLTYWKSLQDPWTFSASQSPAGSDKKEATIDTRDLISKATLIINKIATGQQSQAELEEVRRLLLLAMQADQQQPLIPALIAQSLIKKYEASQSQADLADALAYANDAIDLSRKWSGSYDGKFEKIRAQIHSLRGNPAKAIVDIDRRLSLAPRDVSALKDKANYYYQMGDLAGAAQVLDIASELSPSDPSVLIDKGIVYAKAGSLQQACFIWEQASKKINDQLLFSDQARKQDLDSKGRLLASYKSSVGCR